MTVRSRRVTCPYCHGRTFDRLAGVRVECIGCDGAGVITRIEPDTLMDQLARVLAEMDQAMGWIMSRDNTAAWEWMGQRADVLRRYQEETGVVFDWPIAQPVVATDGADAMRKAIEAS